MPIRSEVYNFTFKNTNKVSIIIINFYCNLREGHSFVTVLLERATPNKKVLLLLITIINVGIIIIIIIIIIDVR